jgi:hypothetical protein
VACLADELRLRVRWIGLESHDWSRISEPVENALANRCKTGFQNAEIRIALRLWNGEPVPNPFPNPCPGRVGGEGAAGKMINLVAVSSG